MQGLQKCRSCISPLSSGTKSPWRQRILVSAAGAQLCTGLWRWNWRQIEALLPRCSCCRLPLCISVSNASEHTHVPMHLHHVLHRLPAAPCHPVVHAGDRMDKDRLAKLGLGAVASYGELRVSFYLHGLSCRLYARPASPICCYVSCQFKGRPFLFCRFCFESHIWHGTVPVLDCLCPPVR